MNDTCYVGIMNPLSAIAGEHAVKSFLKSQIHLNIMTYLSRGLSFRQIAHKIDKKYSYVQTKKDFLDKHSMMTFGRWNIDVQALGIVKTAQFYEYKKMVIDGIYGDVDRNFYLSYLSQVMMGEMKYFGMFNYPEEVKMREGFEITSWYYTFPEFNLPFFRNENFNKELEEIFEQEDNKSPFPPRGERIKPDLLDIYICKHVQLELGDINLKKYTKLMEEEIGNLVEVRYSTVRNHFQKLISKNIIYPVNPFNLTVISYIHTFFITSYDKIFKFLKAIGKLNIIAAVSFMENGNYLLYVHCPYDKHHDVANFLSNLDNDCQIFSVSNVFSNRGLPYKHYLRKYKKERSISY